MANPSDVREQAIGPFSYDEAVSCIQNFALALTNLGLNNRFTIKPGPRRVAHTGKRTGFDEENEPMAYQVILVDHAPGEPRPQGLSTLHIRVAESKGYTKPKVAQYEAFGQRMNLSQWAKAVGVSRPTLKNRIQAGMTMEEALTDVALKKAS